MADTEKRIVRQIRSFPQGIDSYTDPLLLPRTQLAFAENSTMRGDFVTQRPNFFRYALTDQNGGVDLASFQSGLYQGACYYRSGDIGSIMVSVAGNLFQITPNTATLTAVVVQISPSSGGCQAPLPPASLSASAGSASVSLSWSVSTGATSYNVFRGTVSGGPYQMIAAHVSGGYVDSASTDPYGGPSNGVAYYYVVEAVNSCGISSFSPESSATPVSAIPLAPTGLTASPGDSSIVLNWNASVGALTYNIYRGTSSGGESGTAIATGVSAITYTDNSVSNGTQYFYYVKAVNASGTSGQSNEANAIPTNLVAPVQTAITLTGGGVRINWNAVTGASSYTIYRGTTPGGESGTPIETGTSLLSFQDNAVVSGGSSYYYVVTAVSGTIESPKSNEKGVQLGAPLAVGVYNGTGFTPATGVLGTTYILNSSHGYDFQWSYNGSFTSYPGYIASFSVQTGFGVTGQSGLQSTALIVSCVLL